MCTLTAICGEKGDINNNIQIGKDLMSTYNEWRRHVACRLDAEPEAYSTVPLTLLLREKDVKIDAQVKERNKQANLHSN